MAFTVSNKMVEVEVEYLDLENGSIIVVSNETQRRLFKDKIKICKLFFNRPKGSNFNLYMKDCVSYDERNNMIVDTMKVVHQKFLYLLERVIDGDGIELILTNDFYDNIDTDFMRSAIDSFDAKIFQEKIEFLQKMGIFDDETIKAEIKKEEEEIKKEEIANGENEKEDANKEDCKTIEKKD